MIKDLLPPKKPVLDLSEQKAPIRLREGRQPSKTQRHDWEQALRRPHLLHVAPECGPDSHSGASLAGQQVHERLCLQNLQRPH